MATPSRSTSYLVAPADGAHVSDILLPVDVDTSEGVRLPGADSVPVTPPVGYVTGTLSAPGSLTPSDVSTSTGSRISLTWAPSAGATKYEVDRDGVAIAGVTTNSYVD